MMNDTTQARLTEARKTFTPATDAVCEQFQKLADSSDTFVDWVVFWFVDGEAAEEAK